MALPSWTTDLEPGVRPDRTALSKPSVRDRERGTLDVREGAVLPSTTTDDSAKDEDLVLMARVRDGCRESLAALVRRYWARLVRYSAEILRSRDEAQDVVQETFIRIWASREDWTPRGTVSAYLYRIARNLSLNADRDRKGREQRRRRAGPAFGARRASDPEGELEAGAIRGEVQGAIDRLPLRQREVFILSRFHGLTHQEIADTMGISHRTVANQMMSALHTLRSALEHLLRE